MALCVSNPNFTLYLIQESEVCLVCPLGLPTFMGKCGCVWCDLLVYPLLWEGECVFGVPSWSTHFYGKVRVCLVCPLGLPTFMGR